jgi:hypothetical protein
MAWTDWRKRWIDNVRWRDVWFLIGVMVLLYVTVPSWFRNAGEHPYFVSASAVLLVAALYAMTQGWWRKHRGWWRKCIRE